MATKAFIFDIYKTLLNVTIHTPEEREELWQKLYVRFFGKNAFISFQAFSEECDRLISWQHEQLKSRGIIFPEINWEEIVKLALPEVLNLKESEFDDFIFQQSRVWHSVEMQPEVADFLKFAKSKGAILGIASNCQNYTLRELEAALKQFGLSMGIFESDLCFYSYRYGFSKPNPHVFRILNIRLENMGIKPHETMMIGDSIENDILPSRQFNWDYWLINDIKLDLYENSGTWNELKSKIKMG